MFNQEAEFAIWPIEPFFSPPGGKYTRNTRQFGSWKKLQSTLPNTQTKSRTRKMPEEHVLEDKSGYDFLRPGEYLKI